MNRSELRKKIMTILYQINVYNNSKMNFDLEEIIKEAESGKAKFITKTFEELEAMENA